MRRDLIAAIAGIVVLVVVAFVTAPKPAGPTFATRSSDDYAFGGYRAWYEVLAREGVAVERFHRHHDALPDANIDTLVLAFPANEAAAFWDASERSALRQWVRAGGRLIDIGLTPPTSADDGKQDAVLGDDTEGDDGPLTGSWAGLVARLPVREDLRLVAQPHHRVETLLRDRAGIIVARYRLGRGEIVAVAPASTFQNHEIGRGDAARLAYLLGTPRRPGGHVAFDETVRGDVTEKAWYLALDVPERVALGIAALAGLLWLAYGLFSLGPPVRLRAAREPTSEEFLDAFAALYGRSRAREHARDALVLDARRNLEHAPRTPATVALGARIDAAADDPVPDDATLVAVAVLARTAREETIRAGRNRPDNARRTPARGVGTRRRRR